MKKWCTEIIAEEAKTGEIKKWVGENIEAPSWGLAQQWCDNNKGYLKVVGELISEIPCKSDNITPDWDKRVDYDIQQNN